MSCCVSTNNTCQVAVTNQSGAKEPSSAFIYQDVSLRRFPVGPFAVHSRFPLGKGEMTITFKSPLYISWNRKFKSSGTHGKCSW